MSYTHRIRPVVASPWPTVVAMKRRELPKNTVPKYSARSIAWSLRQAAALIISATNSPLRQARRNNVERLKRVRQRAYEDLFGTLAWVRELVSMIHLAKFTGAPASRAEELVAQIAATVEGLS